MREPGRRASSSLGSPGVGTLTGDRAAQALWDGAESWGVQTWGNIAMVDAEWRTQFVGCRVEVNTINGCRFRRTQSQGMQCGRDSHGGCRVRGHSTEGTE